MALNYDVFPAARVLERGGLILYPTDTIWGIGCDATDPAAVASVYKLKRRDPTKSFVILVDCVEMLRNYVAHLHPRLETLHVYHERPLTVIYKQGANLAPNVTAPDGSIAIRIVQDNYCRDLIQTFGKPLVATSANVSNEPFPAHFGEVSSEIIQGVDFVERYRQQDKSVREPSVIVRLDDKSDLEFLRG